jgi:hypothetical protein
LLAIPQGIIKERIFRPAARGSRFKIQSSRFKVAGRCSIGIFWSEPASLINRKTSAEASHQIRKNNFTMKDMKSMKKGV